MFWYIQQRRYVKNNRLEVYVWQKYIWEVKWTGTDYTIIWCIIKLYWSQEIPLA